VRGDAGMKQGPFRGTAGVLPGHWPGGCTKLWLCPRCRSMGCGRSRARARDKTCPRAVPWLARRWVAPTSRPSSAVRTRWEDLRVVQAEVKTGTWAESREREVFGLLSWRTCVDDEGMGLGGIPAWGSRGRSWHGLVEGVPAPLPRMRRALPSRWSPRQLLGRWEGPVG